MHAAIKIRHNRNPTNIAEKVNEDVVFRACQFRNDPGKLIYPLNKLFLKGYHTNTAIRSLNCFYWY